MGRRMPKVWSRRYVCGSKCASSKWCGGKAHKRTAGARTGNVDSCQLEMERQHHSEFVAIRHPNGERCREQYSEFSRRKEAISDRDIHRHESREQPETLKTVWVSCLRIGKRAARAKPISQMEEEVPGRSLHRKITTTQQKHVADLGSGHRFGEPTIPCGI